jgi:glutamate synthase (ferredoxin)
VEAVGDHGCEYMTGGKVVILGPTGRNFAAGMSGGVAYVLDETGDFKGRCNLQGVNLKKLEDREEIAQLQDIIERHAIHTRSSRAAKILNSWKVCVPKFVKVLPKDYERMISELEKAQSAGLSGDEAWNAAFEANARDVARIGGG